MRETPSLRYEAIVWDNASADGSAEALERAFPPERYPHIRHVAGRENLGFARANNEAARLARGRWIVLLNPDTEVLDRAIERLVAFGEERAGRGLLPVAGGRTYYPDGRLNPWSVWRLPSLWGEFTIASGLAGLLPGMEWSNPVSYGGWKRDREREVGYVSGCLLLIPHDLWRRLGGFAPEFFMYSEDEDLGFRARRAGATCLLCPDARIVHHQGRSEPSQVKTVLRLFRAKAQFMRKHWSRPGAWLGRRILDLRTLRRLATALAKGVFSGSARREAREWREVARRRAEWWNP